MADDEWKLVLEGSHPARALPPGAHARAVGQGGVADLPLGQGARRAAGPGAASSRGCGRCSPRSSEKPFDDPALAFELKWDGYRALALVTSDETALRSRNGRDLTPAYPDLARPAPGAPVPGGGARRRGRGAAATTDSPDFNALQNGRGPFTYVVFDLLHVDGEWICDLPWSERRERARGGRAAPTRRRA